MRLLRQTSLPISLCIVHYLGQRYILYNRRGNTSGVYSPNIVEAEFCELLRPNGILRISGTASLQLGRHYSSTAMASISTSCPSMASMDTPNSVLAAPAMPDSRTATQTELRSPRSAATT